ncbi:DUF6180 family protein [Sphingobium sufflavum]|uniref:DUF6180 family protein n=1 Tax=Sphingobium sufflavum TaxID=1129547 RepID=UPI001F371C95|nr:DUF6180 family protein [Sphingobium sufflavum]MCE7798104.1 DUF6180 family protein [Sphingobium sufflavum]
MAAFVNAWAICAPASAASEKFGLEYRVERSDAGKLSVPECLKVAESASSRIGYVAANRQIYPGKLAVFASGPKAGGGSLTVYCIAVDRKTAYVVQALDYNRQQSSAARRAADAVHTALSIASR